MGCSGPGWCPSCLTRRSGSGRIACFEVFIADTEGNHGTGRGVHGSIRERLHDRGKTPPARASLHVPAALTRTEGGLER